MNLPPWFELENPEEVASPALLVHAGGVKANIARMLEIVGGDASRLRPHVKTHKSPDVVRLQLDAGIRKFKCATIAETEMTAEAGADDVLLAYQPVGPNIGRFAALCAKFPKTRFSAIVDCPEIVEQFAALGGDYHLFVDLDCGMGRTGAGPEGALGVCRKIAQTDGVTFAGIHAYDGHIHDPSLEARRREFEAVTALVRELAEQTNPPAIVAGGSPTFGLHAAGTWECSPGTTLFWDAGYGTKFPDLDFEVAVVLLTRVASKPGKNRLCLELGHKAVSAENPIENRARFVNLDDAKPVMQSEEHLVVETPNAAGVAVGDVVYAVPWHICPTVALHEEACVVRDGRFTGETWKIGARRRKLSI